MGLMRIPYTAPLPHPRIFPTTASDLKGSIEALSDFLTKSTGREKSNNTLVLTGAGISVASGLADYRGTKGTYTLNKTYRPVYYHEFCESHEARKRYWARSFLGWTNLSRAKPNSTHTAIKQLGDLGLIHQVITQNVDSFHNLAHPEVPVIELHGYLRTVVCISCRKEYDRREFQKDLIGLNPAWAEFLERMLSSGALTTENPDERRMKGLKTNPDGDVDVPGVEYSTFLYPPCPSCRSNPPRLPDGSQGIVRTDERGGWDRSSTAGILKPNVVMFGESIPAVVKEAAEKAIDDTSRVLVLGSSLATYSAWRLIKRAKERRLPIGIINIGGVRGEEHFYDDDIMQNSTTGANGFRCAQSVEDILPEVANLIGNGAKMV